MKPGITLYLVRHGETDWNRDARYQGQRDIPLNDFGRTQACRNGLVLKDVTPTVRDHDFVSSPLSRAVETMTLIRKELGLKADDFRQEAQLSELNYGHWEGQLAADLELLDPIGIAGKKRDPFAWRPSGGESYRDLQMRVSVWLSKLQRDTVAVTHGGVSRVARGAIFNLDTATIPFLDVPQNKILMIRHDEMTWL